jgi:predicted ArsR family transcriptional regulator
MQSKYAMSVKDVARNLRISDRHAWRFISKLEAQGLIYLRYRQRFNYYSIRKNNEDRETNGSCSVDEGRIQS